MRGVKVFGRLAYAHIPKEKSNKLDPRAKPMILVGGPHGQTYRVFDPDTHVMHRVRHVHFNETGFPGFRIDDSRENIDESELFVELMTQRAKIAKQARIMTLDICRLVKTSSMKLLLMMSKKGIRQMRYQRIMILKGLVNMKCAQRLMSLTNK
jgi:hypothetical protein